MLRVSIGRMLLSLAVAACGSGRQATPDVHNASGAQRNSADVRIHCEPHGNAVATGATTDDVPIVALFERNAWHSGFDVPTLLVWADGTVIYSEGVYGESLRLMQSTSTTWNTRDIAERVARRLHDAAPYVEVTPNWTDQPSVQIVVRDEDAWRVVEVYGLTETVKEKDVPASAREFFAAYHELLEARPTDGVPAPTTYRRPPRWPDSLPSYRGQMTIDQLVFCAHGRE